MVNVMGDALATGIMAHICRKDFMKEGDGVSFNDNMFQMGNSGDWAHSLLLGAENFISSVSLIFRGLAK